MRCVNLIYNIYFIVYLKYCYTIIPDYETICMIKIKSIHKLDEYNLLLLYNTYN